jgi:hypothetical protein
MLSLSLDISCLPIHHILIKYDEEIVGCHSRLEHNKSSTGVRIHFTVGCIQIQ